jgi:hypothetical protein
MKEYASRTSGFSKDPDYLNVFFEVTKNKTTHENVYDIFCRPGLQAFSASLQSTTIRQVYYWESQEKYFIWIDDDIQIVDTSGTILTTVTSALGTSSGDVAVTEFLYDDGSVKLVFTDGTSLKTIDSSYTVVASADADLPTPMKVALVFLDGYLFVVKAGTFDIYNSDLNDPLAWTAGNYISAEMVPDPLNYIAKLNNYLVAFGSSSIEYFWDSAEATGSPLSRNDTPVKYNGFLGGFATLGNKIYFIGNSNESTPGIFVLEDFKIKQITNESLQRQLEATTTTYTQYSGCVVSFLGHNFYLLTAGIYTYAIDLETELWTRWAIAGGMDLNVKFSTNSKTTSTYLPVVYISGQQILHKFISTATTDSGSSYTWTIVTGIEDFDSYNQKVINRLTVYGDRPSDNTTMSISWTDDDYQTFSTAQTVNLNQELPCIYQCGSFRRRAHKLTCTPTVPFRIRYLELDINLGNS